MWAGLLRHGRVNGVYYRLTGEALDVGEEDGHILVAVDVDLVEL